jgi:hypothetical protein
MLYKLEALDDNKDVLAEFKQMGFLQFERMVEIKNTLIIATDVDFFSTPEGHKDMERIIDALAKKLNMSVVILNLPNSDKVRFLKVTGMVDPVKGKGLYSRKLRLGRKHGAKDIQETNGESTEEEEKVQEEETTTRVKEDATRWGWPF